MAKENFIKIKLGEPVICAKDFTADKPAQVKHAAGTTIEVPESIVTEWKKAEIKFDLVTEKSKSDAGTKA